MCDSSNLRRDSSWPRRPNSPAIDSSHFVDRKDNLQVLRFVGQVFQRILSALEPDQRLVVSLLVLGGPREIDETTRVRLLDIRVKGAAPPLLQKLHGVHEQLA